MATQTFRCRLITREALVLDEQATAAVVPSWDGLLGVLPNRAPIVAQLGTGELRLDFPDSGPAKGGSRAFFVNEGFVQMVNNELTILAVTATPAESLSETEAQAEVAELSARNVESLSQAEKDRVRDLRQKAAVKLRTARSFKARGAI
jgi:F-type H+-transporting ATPase subunit epsilon